MHLKRLFSIWKGRRLWLRLRRRYHIDDGLYVLLMPEHDRELNGQALLHIDDLIEYRHAKGVLVMTNDAWVEEVARARGENVVDVLRCTPDEIDALFSCYELYRFSERLLIVSLNRPYGNEIGKAAGVNGITVEDLVCLGILGLRSWSGAAESESATGKRSRHG